MPAATPPLFATTALGARSTAALPSGTWGTAAAWGQPRGRRHLGSLLLIAGLHLLAGWGLLQLRAMHAAQPEATPIYVSILDTATRPATAPAAAPRPHTPAPPPPPQPLAPPSLNLPPAPTPSPVNPPAPAVAEVAPAAPVPESPAPARPAAPAAVAAEATAPAAAARQLPASAIQYLVPPPLEYPRASRRQRESGRAVISVFIDEAGLPRTVRISQSTGFPLLDEAALAAVRKARFKPWIENGQAVAGWALIPLRFDLEG